LEIQIFEGSLTTLWSPTGSQSAITQLIAEQFFRSKYGLSSHWVQTKKVTTLFGWFSASASSYDWSLVSRKD